MRSGSILTVECGELLRKDEIPWLAFEFSAQFLGLSPQPGLQNLLENWIFCREGILALFA
jgi:hypothetical protein